MVEQSLQPILDLMDMQIKEHGELLELSYEKGQVIIKNDTERLNEIVQQELRHLSAINKIEKKRIGVLAEISKEIGMAAEDVTVGVLAEHAGGETRDKLEYAQKELLGILRTQSELNEANRKLIETQLEFSDAMLNLLVGDGETTDNFYGADGKSGKTKTDGRFKKEI